jgi:hypothetical protein
MAAFTFTLPNGAPFELKGPPGLTLEQAKAIFDKQATTGSLVGLKPGDIVSASTQAAQGLASAQAAVGQALSGITGALGAGIPGAAGAIGAISGAVSQAGGALGGSLTGITAGVSGAVGAAVTNFSAATSKASEIASLASSSASSVASQVSAAAGSASKSLMTSAAQVAGSITTVASTSINTINKAMSTPVTLPIDLANFSKQASALMPIGSMTTGQVTGVLAQAKNLVGQAASVVTDAKGLGAYGFDAKQLESAGILKPGIAALAAAGSSFTNIIKSPAAFTGKDGIKSASDLLNSLPKQDAIQQTLMAKGVSELSAVGVPTNLLSGQGLAGMALNAAKSVPDAAAFAQKLPIPGDAQGAITDAFNKNVRDGAFAANFSAAKVPAEFKAEVVPAPASDTVNRDTVDAASARVVGNEKVPEPNYGPTPPAAVDDNAYFDKFANLYSDVINNHINPVGRILNEVESQLDALEARQNITQEEWTRVDGQYTAMRQRYNTTSRAKIKEVQDLAETATPTQFKAIKPTSLDKLDALILYIVNTATSLKARLKALAAKIDSPTEAT